MKISALIAEFNPFHRGHKLLVDSMKTQSDGVIAIMSGNFTQRGELAIADKTVRAKAAVECGINLVLELPFPYSMSSAEFFSRAGVAIADKIGVVDYLVFGSESGNITELSDSMEEMDESFVQMSEEAQDGKDYAQSSNNTAYDIMKRSEAQRREVEAMAEQVEASMRERISAQSQPSTPPVLKVRFLPYISGRGRVWASS